MKQQLPKREDVNKAHTWDVHTIFKDEQTFEAAIKILEEKVDVFVNQYEKQLKDAPIINRSLNDLKIIYELITSINAYASLQSSVNGVSEANQIRSGKTSIILQSMSKKLDFYDNELKKVLLKFVLKEEKQN